MTEAIDRPYAKEILYLLSSEALRFKDLKAALRGVSSTTLTRRLDELREVNLIRKTLDDSADAVRYTLTEIGRQLVEQLQGMRELLVTATSSN
jgi:DNA-binding HxlR family transcriptional regulator